MKHSYHLLGVLLISTCLCGCTSLGAGGRYIDPTELPDKWRTRAELTGYEETGRYAEAVDFCRRLADASPFAHYTTFGTSGEGRPLPLLILSNDRAFSPQSAKASGKLIVLIENCIHAGECAGKDASLELARDILITGTRRELLDEVIILIMPIFSADGHERFGPHNRINQIGPKEMGWRVTSTNLNLNRDFVKADAVEMRAWLKTWVAWQPDFFFDNHTTNGAEHQYDVFYGLAVHDQVAEPIALWSKTSLLPYILPAMEADGHLCLPYSFPRDSKDITKGVVAAVGFGPRYSNGYGAICNRPAMLVEIHARKPYKVRVRGNYSIMLHTLEELNEHPNALRTAIRHADRDTLASRGGDHDGQVVLRVARTNSSERIVYHGVQQSVYTSEITGGEIIKYSSTPHDVATSFYREAKASKTITPAAAYLVPPQWADVIDRLELHGVEFFRLGRAEQLAVESYRFEDVKFRPTPYESRQIPMYKTVPVQETRDFAAGTLVVPTNQRRAKVAAHLLEPEAPDSLVAWGFFNAIFERKEYMSSYVMEPIARQMLETDAALRQEFEQRLAEDAAFAGNAGQRLNFFYKRSPYYDQRHNVYPVARLTDAGTVARLRANSAR